MSKPILQDKNRGTFFLVLPFYFFMLWARASLAIWCSRLIALDYGTDLVLMKVFLTISVSIALKWLAAGKFSAARAAYA